MKILGVSGSTRDTKISAVHKLVKAVLEASGHEYEIISLRNMKFSGCIACLGCVEDNICKVNDDLFALRTKIVEADAYVIGAPNYYTGMNAATHAFLERWFQFRHQEGKTQWGKLAVAVGVGGMHGEPAADQIEKFMSYNFIQTVAKVSGRGAASCYYCRYGKTCQVSVLNFLNYSDGAAKDKIPDISDSPETLAAAVEAGKLLGKRLREGHDRRLVAMEMQETLAGKFNESA